MAIAKNPNSQTPNPRPQALSPKARSSAGKRHAAALSTRESHTYELQSKLPKGGYIGDYIGNYYRVLKGGYIGDYIGKCYRGY